jgi:hypothetical protein
MNARIESYTAHPAFDSHSEERRAHANPWCTSRARGTFRPFVLAWLACFAVLLGLAWPGYAEVLLDDTWADGTRTDTSLPTDSAWYGSDTSSLRTCDSSFPIEG